MTRGIMISLGAIALCLLLLILALSKQASQSRTLQALQARHQTLQQELETARPIGCHPRRPSRFRGEIR